MRPRARTPVADAEWLSVAQVALLLGLTEKAVRARVARKQLPHRRLGERILFNRAQVAEFLEKQPGVSIGEALSNAERGR